MDQKYLTDSESLSLNIEATCLLHSSPRNFPYEIKMDKYRPYPSMISMFTSNSQHPPRSRHAVHLGGVGLCFFVVLFCPGTPEGSTGSGSGFKASQKTGQRLKVSSDRLGEAGNRTCDPWFTRYRFIAHTTAASLLKGYNDFF